MMTIKCSDDFDTEFPVVRRGRRLEKQPIIHRGPGENPVRWFAAADLRGGAAQEHKAQDTYYRTLKIMSLTRLGK